MDKAEGSTARNTVRTDLCLLLECLKFQMKSPDLQKQALLAVHSICEKREDNVDLLRQMGGVSFLYNLSKSSCVNSDVKETTLFTLGTLAEANVYCKNSLCRKETFADLAGSLMKEDIPLTQRRVSVYLLSVLVANNKSGQILAQTTGCLDILLDLFRTTFPVSTEALRAPSATQTYQLWASVSSALCGCVNNPQNEEGQRICVAAFPMIKIWLQQITLSRTEIFQSICSFIAMTVANNSFVQESFSASGGLDSLTLALVHLASAADTSLLSCQLSVTISKTLSACITDNTALASGLAQYSVVSHLVFLLASPHLDPEESLSVLLTLGHCTVASEEHQSQLVQFGGLPLIITLLTEDTNEEVRKAATFILQTCKHATTSLELPGLTVKQENKENIEPPINMESFRSSARELLQRIDRLEKIQAEHEQDAAAPSTSTQVFYRPPAPPLLPLDLQQGESFKILPAGLRKTSSPQHFETRPHNIKLQPGTKEISNKNDSQVGNMSCDSSVQEEKSRGDVWCPVCKGIAFLSSGVQSLEGDRAHQTADDNFFKLPATVKHSVPKEMMDGRNDEGLQNCKMYNLRDLPMEEHPLFQHRCAGCVLPFKEVNSRTFASLQSSSRHSCDMHRVLQEATERFRTAQCNRLFEREDQDDTLEKVDPESVRVSAAVPQKSCKRDICLTPLKKGAGRGKSVLPEHHQKKYNNIVLTPLNRRVKTAALTFFNTPGPGLIPLKRTRLAGGSRDGNNGGRSALDEEMRTDADQSSSYSQRRKRRDFSQEELHYLLCGVKNFGFSWNSILWSYPFHPKRTNVDLAKKYSRLMKTKATEAQSELYWF